jgi:transposase
MENNELYRKVLGIEPPWKVSEVELKVSEKEVRVRVDYDRSAGDLVCPQCGKVCPVYDHREERAWRHLDSCEFRTWVVATVPRIHCPEHGVQTAVVPWSTPYSRWTLAFESFALWVLRATETQAGAARLLHISEEALHELMNRAVERGLARRVNSEGVKEEAVPQVTIDETSRRGREYVTIVGDGERVLEVAEDHTQEAAEHALKASLSEEQRKQVETITMDMWRAYEGASAKTLPSAEIVYDRFHLVSDLNEAVDQTRRTEQRRLIQEGPSPLTGTKYLWLHRPEELSAEQRVQLDALREQDLETVKVWSLKEAFQAFFSCETVEKGEAFFREWYRKVKALGNEPLEEVAEQIERHLDGVLAFLRHRVTNAGAEGLNSRIQTLKENARGFANTACFRIAILFHLGHLDLDPQPSR